MLRGIVSLAVLALLIATGVAVWLAVRPQGSATRADAKHVPSRHKAKAPRRERALRLPAVLPSRTRTVPILMYHRIDVLEPSLPPITHRLTVDPADFAAQMRWLKRNGFHPVTQLQLFDALERGTRLPSKPVMITFDDGYRDVYRNASAVLQRLHMPATAYVITERVGRGGPSFLTWRQLSILERRGITIGSHTVSHADLTTLDDAHALAELRDSRAALERHLGHHVQWFAYPYGSENERVMALVRRARYVLAVTTKAGSTQSAAAPLELRRYEIRDTTGVSGLASLMDSIE